MSVKRPVLVNRMKSFHFTDWIKIRNEGFKRSALDMGRMKDFIV